MNAAKQFLEDVKNYGQASWFVNDKSNVVFGWKKIIWSVYETELGIYWVYRDDYTLCVSSYRRWKTDKKAYIQYFEDMSVWGVELL